MIELEPISIPKWNKGILESRIKKFNRKAKKLGVSPITISFSDEYVSIIKKCAGTDCTGNTIYREINVKFIDAQISYEIPVIKGWELICNFDANVGQGGFTVFTSKVPGKNLPKKYLEKTDIHCDHCKINRFRKKSYLMRNVKTGEYKEIGSTCIKDFFGHDPKGFIYAASYEYSNIFAGSEVEDMMIDEYRRSYGYDTGESFERFMIMTAACIRTFGWTSRAKAMETGYGATSDDVSNQLYDIHLKPENKVKIEEEDEKIAADTVEWFKKIDPDGNDYLANCKKVIQLGFVPYKMFGVAASMVATYKRELYRKEELNRKKAEKKDSEWVGELKERLRGLVLRVVYKMEIGSRYGISKLYILIDEKTGDKFKTFYSGTTFELEKGNLVKIDGTVKKHDTYKNEKYTMLNRVSLIETIGEK